MTTTTALPWRRDRLAFIRQHGTAMLVLLGGHLWLLPVLFPDAPHGEVVSWSALGVAFAAGIFLGWRKLSGWRVPVAVLGLAALAGLFGLLMVEVFAPRTVPASPPETYREARGRTACSTGSCTGHEAGWAWAERNHVFDPDDCGGKSWSFEEGCRAWAEEQSGGLTFSFTRGPDDTVEVRTTLIDGEPWFVASDVCRALGLRPDAAKDSRLRPEEFQVVSKTRGSTPPLPGLFRLNDFRLRLLSESGLYKLIMRSDKVEALAFQHWIASEVLPSIRKTGTYALADHGREAMPLPVDLAEALGLAVRR